MSYEQNKNIDPDLLAQFVAKRHEIGAPTLAKALNISASSVRMICSGHYPEPAMMLRKFQRLYINVIHCPHKNDSIDMERCKALSTAPEPFSGEAKRAWWTACQTCLNKST